LVPQPPKSDEKSFIWRYARSAMALNARQHFDDQMMLSKEAKNGGA
jgi:hypothetical protein